MCILMSDIVIEHDACVLYLFFIGLKWNILKKMCIVKGILSDSNNIFLWHESEDMNIKSFLSQFQLIPILPWLCTLALLHKLPC